jgi:hypothetical protein
VAFRGTKGEHVVAPLRFDDLGGAFAELDEYLLNGRRIKGGEEIELEPQFLDQIDPSLGAEYLYKNVVAMPAHGTN